ncbi:hypothetical protein HNV12_23690 [Methanococcoides sp. SA1]|nr:hypothetical protein [Methanococcoides sp. SA1]
MRISTEPIFIAFISISIFVSGCAENNDAIKASEALPQAQQFMVDGPDINTNVRYYAESDTSDGHSHEWEKNVTPTAMHKVVVNDSTSTGKSTITVSSGNENVTVNLQDSTGSPLIEGVVKYYSEGWNDFGTTDDKGQVKKELPLGTYKFRMTYDNASSDISQDIGTDPTVVFSTVNTTVELKDSTGNLMDAGSVKYYSGGWYDFGTTTDGNVSRELLPNRYTFNMNYEHASRDISQDIGTDATVVFSTVNTTVELRDSTGDLMDTGVVKYYSGGWYDFGTTTDGIVSRELLPNRYRFFMTYEYTSDDISQDTGTDPTVAFSTGNVFSDSGTCTHYYSVGWQVFTNNMEMLPGSYKFSFSDEMPDTYYNIEADISNAIH